MVIGPGWLASLKGCAGIAGRHHRDPLDETRADGGRFIGLTVSSWPEGPHGDTRSRSRPGRPEVRLRLLPGALYPAGLGGDHGAISSRTPRGVRGVAGPRGRAPSKACAGDTADPDGVPVLRRRDPLPRRAIERNVVLRELRLGRGGVPFDAERADPDRIPLSSLRGTDRDRTRQRTGDGLAAEPARLPLAPRRTMV